MRLANGSAIGSDQPDFAVGSAGGGIVAIATGGTLRRQCKACVGVESFMEFSAKGSILAVHADALAGMSVGAAAVYALQTKDGKLLADILASAKAHLRFIYPDGSLDNSWGSRSYKWTLLDGKTVHGAGMTYLLLTHLD